MIKQIKRHTVLALLLLQASAIYAQITITGKVTDANNGESVPGVSVTVGKAGTFTNADGNYTLTVNPKNGSDFEVNFSCIGYVKKQVAVHEKKAQTINVKMNSDQKLQK